MDMVVLVPAERVAVLSPHLVNYGFVRELMRRDFRIVEVPVEEYWDLAVNGVTLEPGRGVVNRGSPAAVAAVGRAGVEGIPGDFWDGRKVAIGGPHGATLELG